MNYNMPGMEKMIPELFTMFYIAKGRNQEGASSVDGKTTSFKKGKDKKGNFKNGKSVVAPVKKPKVEPETKCFYCKGNDH